MRFASADEFFRVWRVHSSLAKQQGCSKDQLGAINMLTTANNFDQWDGLAPDGPPASLTEDELREWHAVKFFRHAAEEKDPIAAGEWVSLAIGEICQIGPGHVIDSRHWAEVQELVPSVCERMAGLPDTHTAIATRGVLAFVRLVDELFECADVRVAYRRFNEQANTRHVARVAGRTLYRLAHDSLVRHCLERERPRAVAA